MRFGPVGTGSSLSVWTLRFFLCHFTHIPYLSGPDPHVLLSSHDVSVSNPQECLCFDPICTCAGRRCASVEQWFICARRKCLCLCLCVSYTDVPSPKPNKPPLSSSRHNLDFDHDKHVSGVYNLTKWVKQKTATEISHLVASSVNLASTTFWRREHCNSWSQTFSYYLLRKVFLTVPVKHTAS